MRTRTTYTTFEQTVIALYEKRSLTLSLLDTLGWMYRGIEVDSAGSQGLTTSDGKDVQQVCISLVNPTFSLVERGSNDDDDEYWEKELREWTTIAATRWGWV
ncbi:MAG TPA: hypothetical protein VFU49_14110 [Ktedonobacteraceae bacterium]|nr:hypothetical protein [Ktedonobacteraceae bacterium]